MTSVRALPSQPLPRLFLTPVDSPLHEFLRETHRLVEFAPAILDQIAADLDAQGLNKKLWREADRRFFAAQTPNLASLALPRRALKPLTPELAVGRPQLAPYAVYLFLTLRGRDGGCKDQAAHLLLEESMTLHCWLENLGLTLPAASTLNDNLNAVSNDILQTLAAKLRPFEVVAAWWHHATEKRRLERIDPGGLVQKLREVFAFSQHGEAEVFIFQLHGPTISIGCHKAKV